MSIDLEPKLEELIEAFLAHLQRRRRAASTTERWRPELRRLLVWADGRPLAELTASELEFGFLVDWETAFEGRNGRPPAANSVRVLVQAVRALFAFADRYDLLVDQQGARLRNPALRLEAPTVRPPAELDWLRADQDQALLSCPLSDRERIAVFLLRWSGLRVSEATGLRNGDVDLGSNTIHVRRSKSDAGVRPIPIAPNLRPELDRWINYTKRRGWYRPDGPLLVTRNQTPWAAQFLEQVVARAGERAGLPMRLRPHALRRSFGSHLLNSGARLEVVSRLLGHSSTVVTQRHYARLESETVRAEMLAALRQGTQETK